MCKFFIPKKQRYCSQALAPGSEYCFIHNASGSSERVRIPCTLDLTHTVYQDELESHLKKCNFQKDQQEYLSKPYIKKGINNGKEEDIVLPLHPIDPPLLIQFLTHWHKELSISIPSEILQNDICDRILFELNKTELLSLSKSGLNKHGPQISSMISHIQKRGLLKSENVYIEFGSGKATLSHFLHESLIAYGLANCKHILIDKKRFHHKAERRFTHKIESDVFRIVADIADLSLKDLFTELKIDRNFIVISKHLCGVATDLTLNCLFTDPDFSRRIDGIFIALCCHGKITWQNYCYKNFFINRGIDKNGFEEICKMASWYVCNQSVDTLEKQAVGKLCKELLDYGRIQFLRKMGFQTSVLHFVSEEISLENTLLIATRL